MKTYIWLLGFLMVNGACSPSKDSVTDATSVASSTLDTGVLGSVTDIQGTASLMSDKSGNWQVELSWKNPVNARDVSFEIQRSQETQSNPTKKHIDDYKNITTSPYTITNLPADSTQYFVVIVTGAVNNVKASVTSTEYSIKIPLDAYTEKPGAFSINDLQLSNGEVTINWEPATNASFYIIQKGISSGSYPTIVTKLASAPYVDKDPANATQLNEGKTLYYIVIAVNSAGSTNASQEKSISIPSTIPSSPSVALPSVFSVLTGTPGNLKATLSWQSASGAAGYKVKYGTTTGSYPDIFPTITTNTSLTVTGLVNGTTYYFQVLALNDGGSINSSNELVIFLPEFSGQFYLELEEDEVRNSTAGTIDDVKGYADSAGNYYVMGSIYGQFDDMNPNFSTQKHAQNSYCSDVFLIKYNSQGQKQWVRQYGSDYDYDSTMETWVGDVQVDSNGNVYMSFVFYNVSSFEGQRVINYSDYNYNIGVIKYDSNGNKLWAKHFEEHHYNDDLVIDSMIVDSSGNVILASEYSGPNPVNQLPNSNHILMKLDPNGNKVWTGTYEDGLLYLPFKVVNRPPYGDVPYSLSASKIAMSTEGVGSFYILSRLSSWSSADQCFSSALQKFNSSGVELWYQQIGCNTPGNFMANWYQPGDLAVRGKQVDQNLMDEIFVAIAESNVTAVNGNVATSPFDGQLLKLDQSGSVLWTKTIHQEGAQVGVEAIAFDLNGDIYVGGYIKLVPFSGLGLSTTIGTQDYFIAKYNNDDLGSNVNQTWLIEKGASGGGIGYLGLASFRRSRMELNVSGGNVLFVDKTTAGFDGNTQTQSNDIFVARHDIGTGTLQSGTNQVALNSIKYDDWPTKKSGVQDLVIDAGGNFYVTGTTDSVLADPTSEFAGDQGGFLAKYNYLGVLEWIKDTPEAYAIALDSEGYLYISGYYTNQTTWYWDSFVSKYSSTGALIWTQQIRDDNASVYINDINIGKTGSQEFLYLTGATEASLDSIAMTGYSDVFLIKFDTSGVKQWTKTLGSSTGVAYGNGIKADTLGNIYVVGSNYNDSNYLTAPANINQFIQVGPQLGHEDAFLAKFDHSGEVAWIKQIGVQDSYLRGVSVALDSASNVFISGYTTAVFSPGDLLSTPGGSNAFIMKYNNLGEGQWGPIRFGANSDDSGFMQGLSVDPSGTKLYLAGYTIGNIDPNHTVTGLNDSYLAAFSTSDGANLWTSMLGYLGGNIWTRGLILDSTGSILLSGESNVSIIDGSLYKGYESKSGFLLRYNSSGVRY